MPTVQTMPGDVQYIIGLTSGTLYPYRWQARAPALVLSAANGNAFVALANLREIVTAASVSVPANVGMGGGGCTPAIAIGLIAGLSTYYPVEAARVAAYALSAANGSAPVYIARVAVIIAAP